MARFNPFQKVNSRYGAPMGRHGHSADAYDGEGKLYARHCGGDFCAYVEARTPAAAIAIVQQHAA